MLHTSITVHCLLCCTALSQFSAMLHTSITVRCLPHCKILSHESAVLHTSIATHCLPCCKILSWFSAMSYTSIAVRCLLQHSIAMVQLYCNATFQCFSNSIFTSHCSITHNIHNPTKHHTLHSSLLCVVYIILCVVPSQFTAVCSVSYLVCGTVTVHCCV